MRILYLHQYFVPPDGVGGTRSYEIARRLVLAGHRVTLVTSSAFFPPRYRFTRAVNDLEIDGIGLRVIDIGYSNRLSYGRRILAFTRFAVRCTAECLRSEGVDLVFATSTPLTIAVPGIAAKVRHRCPMVFEVRDLWPEMPVKVGALRNPLLVRLASALERMAYRNAARVIALSPGIRDGVARQGYPAGRISVIPNTCDTGFFSPAPDRAERFLAEHPHLRGGPVVTYAGTLGYVNGVGFLVGMAAALKRTNPGIRFLIAGDGREREEIRSLAERAGVLGENLWMIPPLPIGEMPGLLAASTVAASLFIDIPEMGNNSANKFFDALAAGKPVMINYGGWQAELVERHRCGIVVPPGDPDRGAALLAGFLGNRERVDAAARASRRLAETEFARDRLLGELVGIVERTVNDGP